MVIGPRDAVRLTADGDFRLDHATAAAVLRPPTLVCRPRAWPAVGPEDLAAFDILELFAFVHPARFILPTPRGGFALDLPAPANEDEAWVLTAAVRRCSDLRDRQGGAPDPLTRNAAIAAIRQLQVALGAAGVAPSVTMRSRRQGRCARPDWRCGKTWPNVRPRTAAAAGQCANRPRTHPRPVGRDARPDERRRNQADFASAVSQAFQPRDQVDEPAMVLAEAGTGVGKTLGYVARLAGPSATRARCGFRPTPVTCSTRSMARWIACIRTAPRKPSGWWSARAENYLCLLNLEDASRVLPTLPRHGVALGLMARWALATRDGDLVGGDFPAWLGDLLGRAGTLGLADRRGDASIRPVPLRQMLHRKIGAQGAARGFVLATAGDDPAAIGGDDGRQPTRLVFDEGHHIFDAADGAFATVSARETTDLQRWLIGTEHRRGGRAQQRLEDLIADDETALAAVEEILARPARCRPKAGKTA